MTWQRSNSVLRAFSQLVHQTNQTTHQSEWYGNVQVASWDTHRPTQMCDPPTRGHRTCNWRQYEGLFLWKHNNCKVKGSDMLLFLTGDVREAAVMARSYHDNLQTTAGEQQWRTSNLKSWHRTNLRITVTRRKDSCARCKCAHKH